MPSFFGTTADETITPTNVSSTVIGIGAAKPSNANDVIDGRDGNDTIDSGGGNDTVTGGLGNDKISLGAGNDTFIWNSGDGNDTIDGGLGFDTLDFTGANLGERISLFENGGHLTFTRDIASVTMDLTSVERIVYSALGGSDLISIRDLSGTGVKEVLVSLASTRGGAAGDQQFDSVAVQGSDGADVVTISGANGTASLIGLSAKVTVEALESTDALTINTGEGNDVVDAHLLDFDPNGGLFISTDLGNDTVIASKFNDLILTDSGNDIVTGGKGNDVALMGSGIDTFIWNAGDGNDSADGQEQVDTAIFNLSAQTQRIDLVVSGTRVLMQSVGDGAAVDMNGIEQVAVNAGDSGNTLVLGDFTGTNLVGTIGFKGGKGNDIVNGSSAFNDLVLTGGGGADALIGGHGDDTFRYFAGSDTAGFEGINGRDGIGDAIQLFNAGNISFVDDTIVNVEVLQFASGNSAVSLLSNQIDSFHIDTVIGGAGNDVLSVAAAGLDPRIELRDLNLINWNDAKDTIVLRGSAIGNAIIGTSHNDIITGGLGADAMLGAGGNDIFRFASGAEVSVDEGVFGDAGTADRIELRNTGKIDFTSSVVRGVETLDFVTGTSAAALRASQIGAGAITTVSGSAGADTLTVSGTAVNLGGVAFTTFAANDRIIVAGTAGADVLTGSKLADSVIGSTGNDVLTGGLGRDALAGGLGSDRFVFRSTIESGRTAATRDAITDFKAGDHIDLHLVDARLGVAGNQAFKLDKGGSFTAGEIHQKVVGGNLVLEINTDGDAAAEMSILVQHRTALLGNGDFVF